MKPPAGYSHADLHDTMSRYPDSVELCEVGPRDGFQYESLPIDTAMKVEAIRSLAAAGLPRIQITSFVHPGRVPQMADAEMVVEATADLEGCVLSGLALNRKGVDRAAASGLRAVDLSIATNETHGHENAGMSVDEGVSEAAHMIEAGRRAGMEVQMGLQTVFGYKEPGDTPLSRVLDVVRGITRMGVESLSLADSTGLAGPEDVRRVLRAVQDVAPDTPLVLHLHDTRGLGLANVAAAMEEGVRRFDTSLGGLGGCPFIPGATGNIATEDTVWLLERLGVACGVDRRRVAEVSRLVSTHLGRALSGRLWTLP